MKSSKPVRLCNYPFQAPAVLPDGLGYCCMPNTKIFKNMSMEEVFYSPELISLRKQMIGEEPLNESCRRCIEIWGTIHSPMETESWDVDLELDYSILSIARNNDCNQACRMCSSRLSTQLGRLHKKLGIDDTAEYSEFDLLHVIKQQKSKIKYVGISGGLPILDDGLYDILLELDPDVVENIVITTNGTKWPEHFLKAMTRFTSSNITFNFSIDGDYIVSEQLRLFSNNNRTYKTMNQVSEYMKYNYNGTGEWQISVQTVISNVNAHRMKRFYRELISNKYYEIDEHTVFFANMIHYPVEMTITIMPKKDREYLINKVKATIAAVKNEKRLEHFNECFIHSMNNMLKQVEPMTHDNNSDEYIKTLEQFHIKYDSIYDKNIIDIMQIQ